MDLEAIYTQGMASGNHLSGLQAVFNAGANSVAPMQSPPVTIITKLEAKVEEISEEIKHALD